MGESRDVPVARLRRRCDPSGLPFETTASLEALDVLGQERALDALKLGLGLKRDGWNVFAMGPTETGKRTLVRDHLGRRAAEEAIGLDACYVHDFERPHRPRLLLLRAGLGKQLRGDLERLVEELRAALPAAFESQEHRARKQLVEDEVKEKHEKAFEELRERARKDGVALLHAPMGFIFAPLKGEDILPPEQFAELPEDEQERLARLIEGFQGELQALIGRTREWAREAREKIRALGRELATSIVGPLVNELEVRYEGVPEVVEHLQAVRKSVLENVGDFISPESASPLGAILGDPSSLPNPSPHRRYLVNVLVDRTDERGAPVVVERHPTLQALVGRVEHLVHVGALLTDFHLIRPGALHRANGGYLLLDAHALLVQPFAYEALKRALLTKEIRMESAAQVLSMTSTVTLDPQPAPLDVKVVLLGERRLYYLLDLLDPEFRTLFKVVADFDEDLPRDDGTDLAYARHVAALCRREGLAPLDREAVARVVEQGARLAGDSERLSVHAGSLVELLRESEFRAREAGRTSVAAADVEEAIDAARRRESRVRDAILDDIRRGTILVDVSGSRVGQVNGLSVLQLGRFAFGRPSRITARVRMGRGEIVDIEREAELAGPIHSKGVLILEGYLGSRYATRLPLSLSATLVFEQSYGMVEGDSASCAELLAILSAAGELPLAQGLAVTGSVNQHGEVQPIGGVNEKIEGFYDACVAKGLDGSQGVIIPSSNVKHLMLRPDVVAAVAEGRFRVLAVDTVDQALELLGGLPAGERDASGEFPSGSANALVEARLVALARARLELLGRAEGEKRS